MKLKETILKLLYNLVRRRRVSIFEPRGGDELWYTHVSPLSGLFLFVAMLIIFMVAATALVSYTPVLEMLPGYKSEFSRSRERVVEGIMRLDSLERVIDDMMIYAENISLIMDGKTPIVRDIVKGDSLKLSKRLIAPNSADSALRRQIESDVNISMRSEYQQRVMSGAAVALIAPVEGEIASSFDIKGERYGVEIFTEPDDKVLSVGDGIVLLSIWTPSSGYIAQILHPGNLISIYKNMSQSLLTKGQLVKSGEVIGFTPLLSNERSLLGFELWSVSRPANPEEYILF